MENHIILYPVLWYVTPIRYCPLRAEYLILYNEIKNNKNMEKKSERNYITTSYRFRALSAREISPNNYFIPTNSRRG